MVRPGRAFVDGAYRGFPGVSGDFLGSGTEPPLAARGRRGVGRGPGRHGAEADEEVQRHEPAEEDGPAADRGQHGPARDHRPQGAVHGL
eukprot:5645348-Pyramimonas_sp.AAC.1